MNDPMSVLLHSNTYKAGDTSKERICYDFQKGRCLHGDTCRFSHNAIKEIRGSIDETTLTCIDSKATNVKDDESSTSSSKKQKKKEKKKSKKNEKIKSKSKSDKKSRASSKSTKEKECPICFEVRSVFCTLGDCDHEICDFCASSWSSSCPVCRGIKKADIQRTALRKRRLERENSERKKAAMLLAKADIYGPAVLNATFHQQFHPDLSRK